MILGALDSWSARQRADTNEFLMEDLKDPNRNFWHARILHGPSALLADSEAQTLGRLGLEQRTSDSHLQPTVALTNRNAAPYYAVAYLAPTPISS